MRGRILLLFCLLLGLMLARPSWAAAARYESAHFSFQYEPRLLSPEQRAAAVDAAEAGYARCAGLFPVGKLPRRVTVALTPSFLGSAGYADAKRARIAVRVPELDYLGLELPYVLTHEVAHLFTAAELAARGVNADGVGPWGEGLADFAAGGFAGMPLADWWGEALQSAGLWADPRWLIDGAAGPSAVDFACARTSTYDQAALFIRYLSGERGREAFFRFYSRYAATAARGAGQDALSPLFQEAFGVGGKTLLRRWRDQLAAAPLPAGAARRLVLHQQVYAALRHFEMNRAAAPDAAAATAAFSAANRALRAGDLAGATLALARAQTFSVPQLRQESAGGPGETSFQMRWQRRENAGESSFL